MDLEKHSVTEILLNQGIVVSDASPLTPVVLFFFFFLAVEGGPKQTTLQRMCLKENRRHVWDKETERRNWQEAVSFHCVTDI